MQYLADRYDTEHKISYPRGTREYYDINSWVSPFILNPNRILPSTCWLTHRDLGNVADGWPWSHAGPGEPLLPYVTSPFAGRVRVRGLGTNIAHLGYAPEKIQYGIDRYQNETRRLYRVMDTHLAKSPSGYLVGDRVTIADISCWGWVKAGCTFFPLFRLCSHPIPSPPIFLHVANTVNSLGRHRAGRVPRPQGVAGEAARAPRL